MTATGWKRELLPPGLKFLCVHRDDRGRLLAGGYDGIWMRDAAGAWAACPLRGKHGYATFVHDLTSADGTLYAISTNGTVNTSTDGTKWTGRKSGIKHNGRCVIALGGGRVVAFQERGRSAVSTDGAKTFALGDELRVDDVWFDRSTNVLYAAGFGALARSKDGGATWTSLKWSTSESARGVYAAGKVVLVVSGKRIVRSEDGGRSWSVVHEGEGDDYLTRIRGCGLDVYAAGYRGTVLHSRDGGSTWAREELGLFAELQGLHCAEDAVYVVGDDSVVLVLGEGASEMPAVTARRAIAGWSAPPSSLTPADRPSKRLRPDPDAYASPAREQHCAYVASLAWADARTLVSADDAGRVLRWDHGGDAWRAHVLAPTCALRPEHLAVHAGFVIGIDDGALRALELSGAAVDVPPVSIGYWTTRLALRNARLFALDSDPLTTVTWDGTARRFVPELERRGRVFDVDATGERVLLYSDGKFRVHARADGAELAMGRGPKYLAVAAFGTSADVVIIQDDNGLVEAIDTATKRRRWKLPRKVRFTRLVPDAAHRYAACFGSDGSFGVLDLAQGQMLHDQKSPADPNDHVTAAAVSPDGENVAVGHADGRVAVHPLTAKTSTVLSPSWRPARRRSSAQTLVRGACKLVARDGGRAVVVCDDRATLVDVDRGGVHELGALPVTLGERDARATLAGDMLLVWDGEATTAIDLAAGEVAWSRSLPIASWVGFDTRHAYAFQGHSSYAVGARIGHTLYRLDLGDGSFEQYALPVPDGAADARGYGSTLARVRDGLLAGFMTEDGRRLACILDPGHGTVRVIANDARETSPSIASEVLMYRAIVSRSGRYVALGGGSPENVLICDLDTPSITARITIGKPGRRTGVLFAPAIDIEHDRVAAVFAPTGDVHVWNARGELVCRYESPTEVSDSSTATFSEDGRALALFTDTEVVQLALH